MHLILKTTSGASIILSREIEANNWQCWKFLNQSGSDYTFHYIYFLSNQTVSPRDAENQGEEEGRSKRELESVSPLPDINTNSVLFREQVSHL